MRRGGGKPKGTGYENKVASILVKAFKHKGVAKRDIYRTKLSGGTKTDKGDLLFASNMLKLFPYTVEAKFYKSFNFEQLFISLEKMKKSWKFKKWWRQLQQECKTTKLKHLLVFRYNHAAENYCGFYPHEMEYLPHSLKRAGKFVVKSDDGPIWVMPFTKFLKIYVSEVLGHGRRM